MSDASDAITGVWECDECGFTRRDSLSARPDTCPNCGAPGDAFSFWSDVTEDDEEDITEEEDEQETSEEPDDPSEYEDGDYWS